MVVLKRIAEEAEGVGRSNSVPCMWVTNWIYRGESAAPSVYGAARCVVTENLLTAFFCVSACVKYDGCVISI